MGLSRWRRELGDGELPPESREKLGGLVVSLKVFSTGETLGGERSDWESGADPAAVQSRRMPGLIEERLSARDVLPGARESDSGARRPFVGRKPSSKDLRRGPRVS